MIKLVTRSSGQIWDINGNQILLPDMMEWDSNNTMKMTGLLWNGNSHEELGIIFQCNKGHLGELYVIEHQTYSESIALEDKWTNETLMGHCKTDHTTNQMCQVLLTLKKSIEDAPRRIIPNHVHCNTGFQNQSFWYIPKRHWGQRCGRLYACWGVDYPQQSGTYEYIRAQRRILLGCLTVESCQQRKLITASVNQCDVVQETRPWFQDWTAHNAR